MTYMKIHSVYASSYLTFGLARCPIRHLYQSRFCLFADAMNTISILLRLGFFIPEIYTLTVTHFVKLRGLNSHTLHISLTDG